MGGALAIWTVVPLATLTLRVGLWHAQHTQFRGIAGSALAKCATPRTIVIAIIVLQIVFTDANTFCGVTLPNAAVVIIAVVAEQSLKFCDILCVFAALGALEVHHHIVGQVLWQMVNGLGWTFHFFKPFKEKRGVRKKMLLILMMVVMTCGDAHPCEREYQDGGDDMYDCEGMDLYDLDGDWIDRLPRVDE